jgi:hypothetical protein
MNAIFFRLNPLWAKFLTKIKKYLNNFYFVTMWIFGKNIKTNCNLLLIYFPQQLEKKFTVK